MNSYRKHWKIVLARWYRNIDRCTRLVNEQKHINKKVVYIKISNTNVFIFQSLRIINGIYRIHSVGNLRVMAILIRAASIRWFGALQNIINLQFNERMLIKRFSVPVFEIQVSSLV